MAYLLLTTGQVVEVEETRAAVRTALGAAGQAVTVTVGGQPLDLRAVGIIGIAENREQLRIVPSWWA
jgi:hypothetical protein